MLQTNNICNNPFIEVAWQYRLSSRNVLERLFSVVCFFEEKRGKIGGRAMEQPLGGCKCLMHQQHEKYQSQTDSTVKHKEPGRAQGEDT